MSRLLPGDNREDNPLITDNQNVEFARRIDFGGQVLVLDGLSGTGKTMLAPILSSMKRVEIHRIEHIYEYVSGVNYLNGMDDKATVQLIQMYIGLAFYNSILGRETNFRWKDLTGVLNNPGGWRYLLRLFRPDGDLAVERMNQDRPILHIVSHQMLGIGHRLFDALGDRLTVVEAVRHPLHLLSHWYSYIDRHGTDPREFTVLLSNNNQALPWFVKGWESKYVGSEKMDKVIYSLDYIATLSERFVDTLEKQRRNQVITVPFEKFVLDPYPYIETISNTLCSSITNATRRALKKQKVPRSITTDGRDLPIYRKYNWRPPTKQSTESMELEKQWKFASQGASQNGLKALYLMCKRYEERYLMPDSLRLHLDREEHERMVS